MTFFDDVMNEAGWPPDNASRQGSVPTPGVPLESARIADPLPQDTPGTITVGSTTIEVLSAEEYRQKDHGLDMQEGDGARLDRSTLQHITQHGLNLIEFYEGFMPHAYWDAFGKVWTVGYGETEGVGPNTTMTRAQAQTDLERRMAINYEPSVRGLGVPLNENQFDALCSFVWNVGPGSMSSSWTIGRLLRAREYEAAAESMMQYDKAGGVVLQGLVNRRRAERALFLTPPPPPPDPHHYKWFFETVDIPGHGTMAERHLVEEYDGLRKHGILNRKKLAPIREHFALLAKHVWDEAHKSKPANWVHDRRGWRFQELLKRSKGERVVK